MISFGCCLHLDREKLLALHDAGYTCYEENLLQVSLSPVEELTSFRIFADSLGMTCRAMNCMFPGELALLTCDENEIRDYLTNALPKAALFSPDVLVLGSGKARAIPVGTTRDRAEAVFAERLRNVILPLCESHGFRVAIEELRQEECNFLNTCGDVMRIVERVGSPNLGLLLDYYHAVLGGDTLAIMEACGNRLFHVHMASPINGRAYPTQVDAAEMKAFSAMLKRMGYDGVISLEGRAEGDFAPAVREALRIMKA